MTGFGAGRRSIRLGETECAVLVEARSVNHRYLDIRVRVPASLSHLAAAIESHARGLLVRGRVELGVRLEECDSVLGPQLNIGLARSAYAQLVALRDELSPDEPVPLSLLASVPDLFAPAVLSADEKMTEDVLECVTLACTDLLEMRTAEGRVLDEDLRGHLHAVRQTLASISEHTNGLVDAHRARLRGRLARLLEGTGTHLDDSRLEHEVAVLAERTDVAEELTRLAGHCDQFETLMTATQDCGRKLDFLLQEMGREVNTLGSKVPDLDVTQYVVELKAQVERMREQVQNVL